MPRRKTQAEFEQDVLNKLGDTYKVLGKYINKETKILMKHSICGNEFLKRPGDVVSKSSGCPYCNGNQLAKYTEDWVVKNTPKPYRYIRNFKNMTTKCYFYCDICKTEFLQSPKRLINESIFGCNCCPTKKKTHEQFLKELGSDILNEYTVLEKYVNIDTKIKFKHNICNSIFELSPWSFIHKHKKIYCPTCDYKKSKGEVEISKFLTSHSIEFKKEFIISQDSLRLDFYLPQENIAIEYDGEQHFQAKSFFGGEEGLHKTQARDKTKNQYCLNNKITLYRIPYTEFENLNFILYQILKEKSSTTIEKYLVTE